MPVVSVSKDLQGILLADVDTFTLIQECYIRQLQLVEEVLNREHYH